MFAYEVATAEKTDSGDVLHGKRNIANGCLLCPRYSSTRSTYTAEIVSRLWTETALLPQ